MQLHAKEIGWAEIARALGFKPSTVTDIKRADRPLRLAEVWEIAHLLGVRPGWLAFGDGPMAEPKPGHPTTVGVPLDDTDRPVDLEEEVEAADRLQRGPEADPVRRAGGARPRAGPGRAGPAGKGRH
jgi:transcriptional regulator with XRE-family HTH domain